MSKSNYSVNPFLLRYPPNNRFIKGAFNEQVEIKIRTDEFGESVVDKESYRLNLTSQRGSIGIGSNTVGKFMFEDGKYNALKDFSYAMRKDLSIVELDRYIKNLEIEQKNADEKLAYAIENEISDAKEQMESLKASKPNDNTTSSE